jgi:hypothetical protein
MICVENAEIALTLIALSVPALKPVFGSLFAHLTEYTSSHTRSRSTKLRSHGVGHSKSMASGAASSNRDSKRLINWSKIGKDDYEMMPSEVSVTREVRGGSSEGERESEGANSPGITVTNEINVVRAKEERKKDERS